MRVKVRYTCEQYYNEHSEVVRGAAQSVQDLYRKMVIGSMDAADYVRPLEFDDEPSLDNPSLGFGASLEEASDMLKSQMSIFEQEKAKRDEQRNIAAEKEAANGEPAS